MLCAGMECACSQRHFTVASLAPGPKPLCHSMSLAQPGPPEAEAEQEKDHELLAFSLQH